MPSSTRTSVQSEPLTLPFPHYCSDRFAPAVHFALIALTEVYDTEADGADANKVCDHATQNGGAK